LCLHPDGDAGASPDMAMAQMGQAGTAPCFRS
jgi:hypothetical protein